jgi:hypothetical protein
MKGTEQVELLALKVADGEAEPREHAELARLVERDPKASKACIGQLEIEAALRSERSFPDLAEAVMHRLGIAADVAAPRRAIVSRTRASVSPVLVTGEPERPLPVTASGSSRSSVWALAGLCSAVAGATLGAVILVVRGPAGPPPAAQAPALSETPRVSAERPPAFSKRHQPAPPEAASAPFAPPRPIAELVSWRGQPRLWRGATLVPLRDRMPLAPGDLLETRAAQALRLARDQGLTLEAGPHSAVHLGALAPYENPASPADGPAPGASAGEGTEARFAWAPFPLVDLRRGTLHVAVHPAGAATAVTVRTLHAEMAVYDARFSVRITQTGTRLEVDEGVVPFRRLADSATVLVEAGHFAEANPADRLAARSRFSGTGSETGGGQGSRDVVNFDFESGAAELLYDGVVRPAPSRPGSLFAAAGTRNRYDPETNVVSFRRPGGPLFAWDSDAVISFDYWVDAEATGVVVMAWNSTQGQNFGTAIRDVTTEAWSHISVRLGDLRPYTDHRRPGQPGDDVRSVSVLGGVWERGVLFVDNFRISKPPQPR